MIDFKYLKPTTMTLVVYMDGNINLLSAFDLLDVVKVDLKVKNVSKKKKFKIPSCDTFGSIMSLRFYDATRGLIRSIKRKNFRNSITTDISIEGKNLSIKLSADNIHITGAKNKEQGNECAQYIIEKINKIQDELDYINSNHQKRDETVQWLLENTQKTTKGPDEDGDNEPVEIVLDRLQQSKDAVVDKRIARFYLKYYDEFPTHSSLKAALDRFMSIDFIGSRDLKVVHIQNVMLNYNYDLGFNVKRFDLYNYIADNSDYKATYNNLINYMVTVSLEYDKSRTQLPDFIIEREELKKQLEREQKQLKRKKRKSKTTTNKKKKAPCHTFLIYKTGRVTMSSPCEELAHEAYNKFRDTINDLRPYIIQAKVGRYIKFFPG
jgi:hypothetical protein